MVAPPNPNPNPPLFGGLFHWIWKLWCHKDTADLIITLIMMSEKINMAMHIDITLDLHSCLFFIQRL